MSGGLRNAVYSCSRHGGFAARLIKQRYSSFAAGGYCVESTFIASVTMDVFETDTEPLSGACTVFPFVLVSPTSRKQ